MSFIAGPHACIGRMMSISEMTAVIAYASLIIFSDSPVVRPCSLPSVLQRARRQFRICTRVQRPDAQADLRRDHEFIRPYLGIVDNPLMLPPSRTCRRHAATRAPRPRAHCLALLNQNLTLPRASPPNYLYQIKPLPCIVASIDCNRCHNSE